MTHPYDSRGEVHAAEQVLEAGSERRPSNNGACLQLEQLRESRTAPWREVQRGRILWRYHSGSPRSIARNFPPTLVFCAFIADAQRAQTRKRVDKKGDV